MHQKTPKQLVNSGLKFQALEPRIMFDGAAVFTGAEALDQIENQNTSQIQNDINENNECSEFSYCPIILGVSFLDQIEKIEKIKTINFSKVAYLSLIHI